MELYIYLIILGVIFLFFLVQTIIGRKRNKLLMKIKIENQWGKAPEREYSLEEIDKISKYFKNTNKLDDYVDDITWNDLDMDAIYTLINNTKSSVGEEVLYKLLRHLEFDKQTLIKRDEIIDFFQKNKEKAFDLEKEYLKIGYTGKISFYEYIFRLKDVGNGRPLFHTILPIILLINIILMFFKPQVVIFSLILFIVINVVLYYKFKAKISPYYICFSYLVKLLDCSWKISKKEISILDDYNKIFIDKNKKLSSLKKGIIMLGGNNVSGSLVDIIMDYIRILFHIDIIKFNQMLKKAIENIDDVDELYEALGEVEAYISIASFRELMPYFTKPEIDVGLKRTLNFTEIYHPLIENPVSNSLETYKGILLTGSNASGKSTFLKTVAINAIFAQTIYMCMAKNYKSSFFNIYSSMSLRDDLEKSESYYIVEIKSLKRILDHSKENKNILCFIDEVLRGTNTIERIAASSHILKSLDKENVMCFAATHDIELTYILDKIYNNYHFSEEITNNDIFFSYKLYKDRATTRNAIKLLGIIGYDEEVIKSAELSSKRFEEQGVWSLENL